MATRNKLWILVNTDEITWMPVVIMFCHQVPMILLGPSRWTVIPGRHHQHRATWLDEADNTWCFMIMEISLKRVTAVLTHFIFSTVHVSGGLTTICVLAILWIVWKAEVVRSTTIVTVMLSTHYTWYKAKKFINNYSLKFCQLAKLIKNFPVLLFASAWKGGYRLREARRLLSVLVIWNEEFSQTFAFIFFCQKLTLISRQLNSSC